MIQKEIFNAIEGNRYYKRNKNKLKCSEDDPIIDSIAQLELYPKKILEIGCSNGARLNLLNQIYSSDCWGIDPSADAIEQGEKEFRGVNFEKGTADTLPYENQMFDMVIFGFCLCWCDRIDLFKIAYEADRVLMDLGHIIIDDFHSAIPYKGLYTYKMNYSNLFLWNPAYVLKYQKMFFHSSLQNGTIDDKNGTIDDIVSVIILKKNIEWAFPDNPY
jgi:ubiquinone/menaquinone biosynthesis C-methylase UbiE